MENAIFLAQIIGIYLVLEGIVILTHKKFIMHIVDDFGTNKALMFVTGAMITILGLLIVLNYNVWEPSWRVIPTLVGWILVIKGVMLFFIPNVILRHARAFARNRNLAILCGVGALIIGAYLIYAGFGGVA